MFAALQSAINLPRFLLYQFDQSHILSEVLDSKQCLATLALDSRSQLAMLEAAQRPGSKEEKTKGFVQELVCFGSLPKSFHIRSYFLASPKNMTQTIRCRTTIEQPPCIAYHKTTCRPSNYNCCSKHHLDGSLLGLRVSL